MQFLRMFGVQVWASAIVLLVGGGVRADWPAARKHVPDSAAWVVEIPRPRLLFDRLAALSRAGRIEEPLFNNLLGTLPGVLGLSEGIDWNAPLVVAIDSAPALALPPLPGQPATPAPAQPVGMKTLLILHLSDAPAFSRGFGLPPDTAGRVHPVAWLREAAHLRWENGLALISTDAALLERSLAAAQLKRAVPPPPEDSRIALHVNLSAQRAPLREQLNRMFLESVQMFNQFLHPDAQTAAHRSAAFWGQRIYQGMDRILREGDRLEIQLGFPEEGLLLNARVNFPADASWAAFLAQHPGGRRVEFTAPGETAIQASFNRDLLHLDRGLLEEAAELKFPGHRESLRRFLEHVGPAGALQVEPAAPDSSLWQLKRLWIFEKKSPDALAEARKLLEKIAEASLVPGRRFELEFHPPTAGADPIHTYRLKPSDPTVEASFLQAFWRPHSGGLFELDGWLMWMENAEPEDLLRLYRHFREHPPRLSPDDAAILHADLHPRHLGAAIGPLLLLADPAAEPLLWEEARQPARVELHRAPGGLTARILLPQPPASMILSGIRSLLFAAE